ncbi:MAG: hypothetical protein RI906_1315, partial [Pseudomonadota bacterium]
SPALSHTQSTGTINWAFNSGSQTFDYLAAGETLILTYTVTVTDDNTGTAGTDTDTVTITITGSNDAPTLGVITAVSIADTSGDDSFTTTSGTLSGSDADTGASLAYSIVGGTSGTYSLGSNNFDRRFIGQYGTLYVASTSITSGANTTAAGAYAFVPDEAAIEGLKANTSESFSLSVSDGTLNAVQTLSVSITAANDTPTATLSSSSYAYTDTSGDDAFNSVDGTLAVNDRDVDEALVVSATGQTADNTRNGFDQRVTGTYGALYLNTTTGAHQYVPDDSKLEALSANASDVFTLTVTEIDGPASPSGMAKLNASATLTINLTAANDLPEISVAAGNSAGGAVTEASTNLGASGTLSVLDRDLSQTVSATVHSVAVSGVTNGMTSSTTGVLSMLTVGTNPVVSNSATTGTINWTFSSGSETFTDLAQGEQRVLTYTVRASDNHSTPAHDDQTVAITITGVNDAPSTTPGVVTATVQSGDSSTLSPSGSISFADVDASDRLTASVTASTITATRGTSAMTLTAAQQTILRNALSLALPSTNTNTGVVNWSYTPRQVDINFLGSGEQAAVVFTVTVRDPQGATSSRDVTVQVIGKNDPPAITDGPDAVRLNEAANALTSSGSLTVTDPNANDTVSAQILSGTVQKNSGTAVAMSGAELSRLSISPTAGVALPNSQTGATLGWSFNSGSELYDSLGLGEELRYTWTIQVTDTAPVPASDTETVEITIVGTNDAPVLTATDVSGSIAEASGTLTDSGSIAFADPDLPDRPTATSAVSSVTATRNGNALALTNAQRQAIENAFSISAAAGNTQNGAINWQYSVSGTSLDFLASGDQVSAVFTVTIDDQNGASPSQNVSITITGTNDGPVLADTTDPAAVIELVNAGTQDLAAVSGSFSLSDADVGNTLTASVLGNPVVKINGNTITSGFPSALVDPSAFTLANTTQVSNGGSVAVVGWTYDPGAANLDFISGGESLTVTWTVQVSDGASGTATQNVVFTLTGTNDVPLITVGAGNTASASLTEADAGLFANGTLAVADADRSNTVAVAVQSVTATGAIAGMGSDNTALLAMLSVDSGNIIGNTATSGTINWAFNSGSQAFNHLAAGEILTLSYTVRVTDSNGTPTSDDETVVITITGTNDAPVISVGSGNSASVSLTETNTTLSSSGTLAVSDLDHTNTVSVSVQSVAASGATAGIASGNAALLAMLSVDSGNIIGNAATSGTINWAFNSGAEAFDYLATGETLTLSYTVRVADSNGTPATDDQTVTLTITGSDDAPLITLGAGNTASASLTEADTARTASGTLAVVDHDYTNTVTVAVQSVATSGTAAGLSSDNAALLAMLTVNDPEVVIGRTATTGTINWAFDSGTQAFNYLGAGETLTLTYTVRVADSNLSASTDDQTVVITITGTNDAPIISVGSGNSASASLMETNTTLTTNGTLAVVDADRSNTVSVSVQSVATGGALTGLGSNAAALLAMLSVDSSPVIGNTATSGTINWAFNSGAEAFDYLAAGETLTLSYAVRVADSNGTPATDDQTVVITVTGSSDAAGITESKINTVDPNAMGASG